MIGIFWFDLPLAVLLTFVFHRIVRNQPIINSPRFFHKRLQPYINFDWSMRFQRSWYIVITSVLVGTGSHIIWDGFTHEGGYFVKHISLLESSWGVFPAYKLLQHISSLIGTLVITWSLYQLPVTNVRNKAQHIFRFWSYLALIAVCILLAKMMLTNGTILVGNLVVSIIAALLLALIIVSFVSAQKANGPL